MWCVGTVVWWWCWWRTQQCRGTCPCTRACNTYVRIHVCACQRGVAPVNLTSATSPRISTTRRGNAHYGCLDMSLSTHTCAHARVRACSTCTCVHDVVFRWAARAHARVCVHSSVRIGVCYMTVLCVRAGCVHARVCTSLCICICMSVHDRTTHVRACACARWQC